MERQKPRVTNDVIDLYIRTYYSLLRSTGEVRVRSFEEAHAASNSSLHAGALEPRPDVAAFAYSAARLPDCMASLRVIVLGQSHEQFEAAGLPVRGWERVRTRGRRRPLRWDGGETLAAFVTSTSDIDDLVPMVTAWQVEWNKLHDLLRESRWGRALAAGEPVAVDVAALAEATGLGPEDAAKMRAALGSGFEAGLREMARRRSDLSIRLLNGSLNEYQRAAQRWWTGIEPLYLREEAPRRPPVYFVSSNTHSLNNLLGGYVRAHQGEIVDYARRKNPEGLSEYLEAALARGDEAEANGLLYYLLRGYIHQGAPELREAVQRYDAESGIVSVESPGKIDVGAQIVQLGQLKPERLDPRLKVPGIERIGESDAIVLNIDYPLGMAAYHHLSRVGQGIGELRGVYVMGKAATLNGRVGDVMVSQVVHDEHSQNTYLFRNCFSAADVRPYLRDATVLDNQKALTVRSTFLQNRDYMGVFYREGYTVLEMEAGPYLSAVYELVNPNRHPNDEIVHLSTQTPFDVGVLHYASDTPYSRRQELLSKSLSYFGVESTYGCALAITRRILANEIARLGGPATTPGR